VKLIRLMQTLSFVLCIWFFHSSLSYASYPLWTFTPNSNFPPQLSINSNQTSLVVYTIHNQSHKAKSLMIKPLQGLEQSLPCRLNPIGHPGSGCDLVLTVSGNSLPPGGIHHGPISCQTNANGTPNSNQCYRPSAGNNLNITLTHAPPAGVTISVTPIILLMPEYSTQNVTVTNTAGSSGPANNVTPSIPIGSSITQTNNCGASLAVGATCTITFSSSALEGPITIPIFGTNTNTVNVYAAVADRPIINITGPAQQNRIVSTDGVTTLNLTLTNSPDSIFNATNITVTNKAACPNLLVDATNCTNLAPGSQCNLGLSTSTPYAPCTITVSGTNTGNSPTTLIAFSHLGGLVFQSDGTNGKVVTEAGAEFSSEWTFPSKTDIPGTGSNDDGFSNTNNIVANSACTSSSSSCAAYRCRAISSAWYLPARNELQAVISSMCPASVYPCAFGSFNSTFYWSSTQWFAASNAYVVDVPDTNFGPLDKWNSQPVRCIKSF
jgi:hypothetical protein